MTLLDMRQSATLDSSAISVMRDSTRWIFGFSVIKRIRCAFASISYSSLVAVLRGG